MARLAKGLPVVAVPEQFSVAFVGSDVINNLRCDHKALLQARLA